MHATFLNSWGEGACPPGDITRGPKDGHTGLSALANCLLEAVLYSLALCQHDLKDASEVLLCAGMLLLSAFLD